MAELRTALGDLADPTCYTDRLNVDTEKREGLEADLELMLTIRRVEEVVGDLVSRGEVACPCHLSIGQEAVAVGVSRVLRSTDRIFGGHRSHAHYLALGGDPYRLFSEILGRDSGCSRGMGGSMHLYDPQVGFHGSVPIVAATIPIAVGAALAAKMDGIDTVAVCYFGDGAAEEGVLHESLNLAANLALPVLFVCENNLFSSHLDIRLRQPADAICRFAPDRATPRRYPAATAAGHGRGIGRRPQPDAQRRRSSRPAGPNSAG